MSVQSMNPDWWREAVAIGLDAKDRQGYPVVVGLEGDWVVVVRRPGAAAERIPRHDWQDEKARENLVKFLEYGDSHIDDDYLDRQRQLNELEKMRVDRVRFAMKPMLITDGDGTFELLDDFRDRCWRSLM